MSYPYRTAHSKVVAWVDVMPKGAHAQRILNARHCRLTLFVPGPDPSCVISYSQQYLIQHPRTTVSTRYGLRNERLAGRQQLHSRTTVLQPERAIESARRTPVERLERGLERDVMTALGAACKGDAEKLCRVVSMSWQGLNTKRTCGNSVSHEEPTCQRAS
ncbi:hypothetical protein HDV57DRAFT_494870 [Trichoderma longibrachiatum]|uniref:Uncharacterized protein n=1 Tax=Trichoderma longibrachiatum ATCC 18648 TaxID=983965 RepID=A0A2T4C5J8_TRILO|nr:hypothetical protein M440DRAFT_1235294 [Trichoderma longibrachiatum ATCC 18648]